MKFIEDKSVLYKHYSKQALIVVASAQGIWALTPADWIKTYPEWVTPAVAGVCAVIAALGLFGALIQQPDKNAAESKT